MFNNSAMYLCKIFNTFYEIVKHDLVVAMNVSDCYDCLCTMGTSVAEMVQG